MNRLTPVEVTSGPIGFSSRVFPSAAIKVYLYTVACDMRRSFDGQMMAEHILPCNPFSGHLLVF